ncbi:MAG: cysteine--1-D-myo-inosityl 2-amino-2-deoxy-alpha-D-glucopyranoside ligase [Mycobacterium leprae]
MQSWPAAALPRLPGRGLPVRVFDTATREVRPVAPGPVVRMYVCGITPYDATHLGHAATYVTFDLLHRAWRAGGHDVQYVQNVTDVDDPLFLRAAETGQDWAELAARETELFRTDMQALRVLPPTAYVGAVQAIPRMVGLIERLRARGAVYDVDGDLYFSVWADRRFGGVSGLDVAEMTRRFADCGGDPDRPGKKDPLDCLLWQAQRDGEPAWPSPFGPGRPGWHVECTAIALAHLGMSFDVQGGGSDLVFPHHEMCASEGQVATGEWPYARAYVHVGMVGFDGEKMSKSRGNLVLVSQLHDAGVDPMAVRLALLAHHYRTDWEWTPSALSAGESRLARWRAAVTRGAAPAAHGVVRTVREALADDLDAPRALTAVDRWAEETRLRGGRDPDAPAAVRGCVDALLGVAL